jgi:hypothetical protein
VSFYEVGSDQPPDGSGSLKGPPDGQGENPATLWMLTKIDTLCAERDKLKAELPKPAARRVLGGRKW